jgi:hypothetical protein
LYLIYKVTPPKTPPHTYVFIVYEESIPRIKTKQKQKQQKNKKLAADSVTLQKQTPKQK